MKQIGPNVYGNANNAMHDCCFYFTRGNDLFTPNYNFFTEAYIFFGHTTYLRLRFFVFVNTTSDHHVAQIYLASHVELFFSV